MYTDYAGMEHRESEVTESMIEQDIEGYSRLVRRFVEMNESASAEMYAVCAYRCARKLYSVRKKHAVRNRSRRERDDAMRSLGLVRVRGALGGVYWE